MIYLYETLRVLFLFHEAEAIQLQDIVERVKEGMEDETLISMYERFRSTNMLLASYLMELDKSMMALKKELSARDKAQTLEAEMEAREYEKDRARKARGVGCSST